MMRCFILILYYGFSLGHNLCLATFVSKTRRQARRLKPLPARKKSRSSSTTSSTTANRRRRQSTTAKRGGNSNTSRKPQAKATSKRRSRSSITNFPRLVIFDLDGCLWKPELQTSSRDDVGAPPFGLHPHDAVPGTRLLLVSHKQQRQQQQHPRVVRRRLVP